jgi:hypothetical protein
MAAANRAAVAESGGVRALSGSDGAVRAVRSAFGDASEEDRQPPSSPITRRPVKRAERLR